MFKPSHHLRLSLLPLLLAACASPAAPTLPPAQPTAAPQVNVEPPDIFFARPEGSRGPAIAYDMVSGASLFDLPPGLASADGRFFFSASHLEDSTTSLNTYNFYTGEVAAHFPLTDMWILSGVSPTGNWLALTRLPSDEEKAAWTQADAWTTDIQILNAQTGEIAHTLTLDGNFEVETISADGQSLYLIQHLPAVNPDHYLIRLYDLSNESLVADPLRSKTTDEVMAGYAIEGLASQNGKWLLTLYLSTLRDTAFVHALNLVDKFPICLDLPSGKGDFDQLKFYTLALSPDGKTIYAANAALGVVAEVGLDDLAGYGLRNETHFETPAYSPLLTVKAQNARSLLSPDGSTLYFTSGQNIWVYDTKNRKVSGPFETSGLVTGFGVSRAGDRLYAAKDDGSLVAFDTLTQTIVALR